MSNYVQVGELEVNDSFAKIINRKLGSTVYKVLHQNVSDLFNGLNAVIENQDTKELSTIRTTVRVSNLSNS